MATRYSEEEAPPELTTVGLLGRPRLLAVLNKAIEWLAKLPYLACLLEGEMDWRIGITQEVAKTLPDTTYCQYTLRFKPGQFFLMLMVAVSPSIRHPRARG